MTEPQTGPVDLVVLGGGSGGYAAALRAAELGMTVVMVEKDKVGGTCLHRGCIPTKALLHSAEVVDTIKEAGQFGVVGSFDKVDMPGVHSYKDKVVEGLFKGLTGLVKSRKIEVVQGTGKLVSPTAVEVDGRRIEPGTCCSRPAPSRARSPAWRSTTSASSPATTPSSSTGSRSR